MRVGDELGYRLLRWLKPGRAFAHGGELDLPYAPKLRRIIGDAGWEYLRDKAVLDFGCGTGAGSIELARHGVERVIGLDIRPEVLEQARRAANEAGVSGACRFVEALDEPVDVILSVDAFEHFEDPAAVLGTMDRLLKEDGFVIAAFGPTWYHPFGGHLFSVFPWSHLIFSEAAQIRWRSDFKYDGATRFSEVSGGLNKITIKRFIERVGESPFELQSFRTLPIRSVRWAHNRITREFTTSVVEAKLVKKGHQALNL
jgi:SAM-dependent methyltransferase